MGIKLFSDRILIRIDPAAEEKIGSIVLPKIDTIGKLPINTTIKYERGTVVSCGIGKPWTLHGDELKIFPMQVKEGDTVLIKKGNGMPVLTQDMDMPKDEYEYRIIIHDEVICVITPVDNNGTDLPGHHD